MRITIFQHSASEPGGVFDSFFEEQGIPFRYVRLFETNEIPAVYGDRLVFLGGPMSVNDEDMYPFLRMEKDLIRHAVLQGARIVGICLGAQLIASAMGGRVSPSVPETGWHRIQRVPREPSPLAGFPDCFYAFQLHGETFEVPRGGRLLCTGSRVRNQAFRYGSALGLQFHLEPDRAILEDWSRDLGEGEREAIFRDSPLYLEESHRLCRMVAGFLTGR